MKSITAFAEGTMIALRLSSPAPAERSPLRLEEIPAPTPGDIELVLKVKCCGLCHTDLHIVEGDLPLPKLPLTPGHQIVGIVNEVGANAKRYKKGDRLGIPWLYSTCGTCAFCTSGRENLCDEPRFTGYQVDGGFAEYVVVHEDFAYPIPPRFSDIQAAPLLCAGVIGYRAIRLSGASSGQRVGLYGFGASAHIAIQVLIHMGCEVYVYTRSPDHRELATMLGATWTGEAGGNAPHPVDAAIVFAPAGELVPLTLKALAKGGTIALAGIHMSPIPEMEYKLLYNERTLKSVANSTREDVRDLLTVAAEIPVRTDVETFPMQEANKALHKLRASEIRGSCVLVW